MLCFLQVTIDCILRCQDLITYELVMERIVYVNAALKEIYVAILASLLLFEF